MSGWEDTVMNPEIRDSGKYWYDRYHGVRDVEAICKAQAKISFKAGIEEAQCRLHSPEVEKIAKEALDEQRLAGRKDVVDWVEIVDTVELDGAKQYTITLEQWQAKMKDWGL